MSLAGLVMTIELREFRPGDYPAVRRLWEGTAGVGLSEGDSQDGVTRVLERNPGLSWVAVSGDTVVGVILCGHDGRRGMIYHLSVAASHRRQRVATRLVQATFYGLRTAGIEQCYAMAYTTNDLARAFWVSVGSTIRTDLHLFRVPVFPPTGKPS